MEYVDTLKYDLNIYYEDGKIQNVVMTGKIGVKNDHELFFFNQTLVLDKDKIRCTITFPEMIVKPNTKLVFFDFEVGNLVNNFYMLQENQDNFDCDFTIDCIKNFLDAIGYFFIPTLTYESYDMKFRLGIDHDIKSYTKVTVNVILKTDDINKVNLYNENKLVWSVKYSDMKMAK